MGKLVIFVPHQDDETNLAGNILSYLVRQYDVYVVYSSLDANPDKARIRKQEARNACAVYGIKKKMLFSGITGHPQSEWTPFFLQMGTKA